MNDLVRTQMMLSMGIAKNPLTNLMALNLFDLATKTFPTWSNWVRTNCCLRSRTNAARATITCERGVSTTTQSNRVQTQTMYQSRMDAVVHYVTTLPAMKSLLAVTQHDYHMSLNLCV